MNTGPGPGYALCLSILAALLLQCSSAPVLEDDEESQTQVQEYLGADNDASGCYYNFQHYDEGDRIITNEPCLNCTCHNKMLMCYLRVCPFTKAIGQDCTIEKKADQCCPVINCPEVPVQLLTSSTTEHAETPATIGETAVGHVDDFGCRLNDVFYTDGAQLPGDTTKSCELCYCIRNRTTCVMQECTLRVEGCRPLYEEGVCCPVRYDCDSEEEQRTTTTEEPRPTPGLILTTAAPGPLDCRHNGHLYLDGAGIETAEPCEHCYCMRGEIVCAVQDCGAPMDKMNCTALPPPPGECCPQTYQCDENEIIAETDSSNRQNRKHESHGNVTTEDNALSTETPEYDAVVSEIYPRPEKPIQETGEPIHVNEIPNKDEDHAPVTDNIVDAESPTKNRVDESVATNQDENDEGQATVAPESNTPSAIDITESPVSISSTSNPSVPVDEEAHELPEENSSTLPNLEGQSQVTEEQENETTEKSSHEEASQAGEEQVTQSPEAPESPINPDEDINHANEGSMEIDHESTEHPIRQSEEEMSTEVIQTEEKGPNTTPGGSGPSGEEKGTDADQQGSTELPNVQEIDHSGDEQVTENSGTESNEPSGLPTNPENGPSGVEAATEESQPEHTEIPALHEITHPGEESATDESQTESSQEEGSPENDKGSEESQHTEAPILPGEEKTGSTEATEESHSETPELISSHENESPVETTEGADEEQAKHTTLTPEIVHHADNTDNSITEVSPHDVEEATRHPQTFEPIGEITEIPNGASNEEGETNNGEFAHTESAEKVTDAEGTNEGTSTPTDDDHQHPTNDDLGPGHDEQFPLKSGIPTEKETDALVTEPSPSYSPPESDSHTIVGSSDETVDNQQMTETPEIYEETNPNAVPEIEKQPDEAESEPIATTTEVYNVHIIETSESDETATEGSEEPTGEEKVQGKPEIITESMPHTPSMPESDSQVTEHVPASDENTEHFENPESHVPESGDNNQSSDNSAHDLTTAEPYPPSPSDINNNVNEDEVPETLSPEVTPITEKETELTDNSAEVVEHHDQIVTTPPVEHHHLDHDEATEQSVETITEADNSVHTVDHGTMEPEVPGSTEFPKAQEAVSAEDENEESELSHSTEVTDVQLTEAPVNNESVEPGTSDVQATEAPVDNESVEPGTSDVQATEAPVDNESVEPGTSDVQVTEGPVDNESVEPGTSDVQVTEGPVDNESVEPGTSDVQATEAPADNESAEHESNDVNVTEAPVENESGEHETNDVRVTEAPTGNESAEPETNDVHVTEAPVENESIEHETNDVQVTEAPTGNESAEPETNDVHVTEAPVENESVEPETSHDVHVTEAPVDNESVEPETNDVQATETPVENESVEPETSHDVQVTEPSADQESNEVSLNTEHPEATEEPKIAQNTESINSPMTENDDIEGVSQNTEVPDVHVTESHEGQETENTNEPSAEEHTEEAIADNVSSVSEQQDKAQSSTEAAIVESGDVNETTESESDEAANAHTNPAQVAESEGGQKIVTEPESEATETPEISHDHGSEESTFLPPHSKIPGEGHCLVNGIAYPNNSDIPPASKCQTRCQCVSSIVNCVLVSCPPPPPEMKNCSPMNLENSCCPSFACDGESMPGPVSSSHVTEESDHAAGNKDEDHVTVSMVEEETEHPIEVTSSEPNTDENEIPTNGEHHEPEKNVQNEKEPSQEEEEIDHEVATQTYVEVTEKATHDITVSNVDQESEATEEPISNTEENQTQSSPISEESPIEESKVPESPEQTESSTESAVSNEIEHNGHENEVTATEPVPDNHSGDNDESNFKPTQLPIESESNEEGGETTPSVHQDGEQQPMHENEIEHDHDITQVTEENSQTERNKEPEVSTIYENITPTSFTQKPDSVSVDENQGTIKYTTDSDDQLQETEAPILPETSEEATAPSDHTIHEPSSTESDSNEIPTEGPHGQPGVTSDSATDSAELTHAETEQPFLESSPEYDEAGTTHTPIEPEHSESTESQKNDHEPSEHTEAPHESDQTESSEDHATESPETTVPGHNEPTEHTEDESEPPVHQNPTESPEEPAGTEKYETELPETQEPEQPEQPLQTETPVTISQSDEHTAVPQTSEHTDAPKEADLAETTDEPDQTQETVAPDNQDDNAHTEETPVAVNTEVYDEVSSEDQHSVESQQTEKPINSDESSGSDESSTESTESLETPDKTEENSGSTEISKKPEDSSESPDSDTSDESSEKPEADNSEGSSSSESEDDTSHPTQTEKAHQIFENTEGIEAEATTPTPVDESDKETYDKVTEVSSDDHNEDHNEDTETSEATKPPIEVSHAGEEVTEGNLPATEINQEEEATEGQKVSDESPEIQQTTPMPHVEPSSVEHETATSGYEHEKSTVEPQIVHAPTEVAPEIPSDNQIYENPVTTERTIEEVSETTDLNEPEIPSDNQIHENPVTTERTAEEVSETTLSNEPNTDNLPERIDIPADVSSQEATDAPVQVTQNVEEVSPVTLPASVEPTTQPQHHEVTTTESIVTPAKAESTTEKVEIVTPEKFPEIIQTQAPELPVSTERVPELYPTIPPKRTTTTKEPEQGYDYQKPIKEKPILQEPEPVDNIEDERPNEYLPPDDEYDEEEEQPYGPGTCRYAGKVYVSAQQIPRDDPCDFCFCFRSDIICLQQSCPPPIPGCHEEPISGFCCPRYECHVRMATVLNRTSTTTTTTTTLPPHFLAHAYKGAAKKMGCLVQGRAYSVGESISSASGPCMDCICDADGNMKCEPKVCTPEPMIRKMMISPDSTFHHKR